ncbi:hypothetical protein AJ87_11055 [Rhizobium yanglingense]|nr:hypothetical protein AJ87_11055 [Rhizobium yanglingense]
MERYFEAGQKGATEYEYAAKTALRLFKVPDEADLPLEKGPPRHKWLKVVLVGFLCSESAHCEGYRRILQGERAPLLISTGALGVASQLRAIRNLC